MFSCTYRTYLPMIPMTLTVSIVLMVRISEATDYAFIMFPQRKNDHIYRLLTLFNHEIFYFSDIG